MGLIDNKEDDQEHTGEKGSEELHSPSEFEFTAAITCAYTVRRNTPTSKVVHESLCAMQEGKVKNLAMYGGGVYVPSDIDRPGDIEREDEAEEKDSNDGVGTINVESKVREEV